MVDIATDNHKAYHDCHHVSTRFYHWHPDQVEGQTNNVEFVSSKSPLGYLSRLYYSDVFAVNTIDKSFGAIHPGLVERIFSDPSLPVEVDLEKDPFDTEFSIWFLLVDLKGLPKLLSSIFGSRARRLRSQKTAKQLHDDNLAIQFGVLPTVSDIRSFLELCIKWKEAYDKLRLQQDQVYTWRAPRIDISDKLQYGEVFRTGHLLVGGQPQTSAFLTPGKAWFSRTMKYRFTCPELTGWLARLRQFIDAFGVLDPAAVWDVLPWSFVIDWFLPVGKWLRRNRPRLWPANVVIIDYCESIVAENTVAHTLYGLRSLTGGPADATPGITPTSHMVNKVYIRRRFIPPALIIKKPQLATDVLTWKRVSISASLIAQKLPRGFH